MESSLYVAVAAQRNMQKQLTVIANNIANMNTTGFRTENVDFKSIVSQQPNEDVYFPTAAKLYPSLEQGALEPTGNPLDVALTGSGWFSIATPQGPAYTRDGRFQISGLGELQTLQGFPVLDAGGSPIQLDPRSGPPDITADGRVLLNSRLVANIGVFEVSQDQLESRFTNSAFFASSPGIPLALDGNNAVKQGFVENSNVNPIKELANLIAITKGFESATSMIERADQSVSRAVSELGSR